MKKRIALTMASLLAFSNVACFAATKTTTTAKTTSATKPAVVAKPIAVDTGKKISAYFYNIKVSINGQSLNSPLEPFIYNDNVYVPLRGIVEGMGGTPTWDGNAKAVTITNNTALELEKLKNNNTANDFQLNNLQAQVKSKDEKIKDLENQISDLEKKVKDLKDDSSSSSSKNLSSLEDDIQDDYKKYSDSSSGKMQFTYDLSKSGSTIDVEMKGDFYKNDDVWKKRSSSSSGFDSFLKDIVKEIHKNSNFDDYDIDVIVKDKDGTKIYKCEYDESDNDYDYTSY